MPEGAPSFQIAMGWEFSGGGWWVQRLMSSSAKNRGELGFCTFLQWFCWKGMGVKKNHFQDFSKKSPMGWDVTALPTRVEWHCGQNGHFRISMSWMFWAQSPTSQLCAIYRGVGHIWRLLWVLHFRKNHESWMQVAKFPLKLSNLEPSCKLLGGRLVFTNQQLVERISHSFFLNWNLWVY